MEGPQGGAPSKAGFRPASHMEPLGDVPDCDLRSTGLNRAAELTALWFCVT